LAVLALVYPEAMMLAPLKHRNEGRRRQAATLLSSDHLQFNPVDLFIITSTFLYQKIIHKHGGLCTTIRPTSTQGT